MQVRIFSSPDADQLARALRDFISTRDERSEIDIQFSTAVQAPCVVYSVLVTVRRPRREADDA